MRASTLFASSIALLVPLLTHYLTNAAPVQDNVQNLPACPDDTDPASTYDYIIIGAGAGGGPLASRLALAGFKVLLMDAGKDYVSVNTTIPLYLIRGTEDPEMALNYEVGYYGTAGDPPEIPKWYPRAQAIGGCTVHNALIDVIPHKWDFDNIKNLTGDSSWDSNTMMQYYPRKIENNQYKILPSLLNTLLFGYGKNGWLNTAQPPFNLVVSPWNLDPQLAILLAAVIANPQRLPVWNNDFNLPENDQAQGGAFVISTKSSSAALPLLNGNSNNMRSSTRDFIMDTKSKKPTRLNIWQETFASKLQLCRKSDGNVKAYGVEYLQGPGLLWPSAKFTGKYTNPQFKSVYAKYEIIVSTGVFQTPQLLMLSGIGPSSQLSQFGIPTVVDLPGVGENLQDRVESSVVWKLKQDHKILNGCTVLYDEASDPCLKDWNNGFLNLGKHANVYSSGAAIYAYSHKTKDDLQYRDMWGFWTPAYFQNFHYGWGQKAAETHNAFTYAVLKAHTNATGWVRLTGNHPQDKLDINKNQFNTPGSLADLKAVVDEMIWARNFARVNLNANVNVTGLANITATFTANILEEYLPGSSVDDTQLEDYVRKNQFGHHACCTAKMGSATDPKAVVDSAFKVLGVDALRIVDNSVWPNIPGTFVTTPIYIISEKAADTVIAYAQSQGWTGTP